MDNNSHISTEEIQSDIDITQKEIDQYQIEIDALSKDMQNNKLPIYLKEGHISSRKDFINKLKIILKKRENNGKIYQ